MARNFAHQRRLDAVEAIEIKRGVLPILIGHEAADALLHDVETRGRKALARAVDQILDTLCRGLPLAMLAHGLVELATGVTTSESERREIGVDRLATFTDRRLE